MDQEEIMDRLEEIETETDLEFLLSDLFGARTFSDASVLTLNRGVVLRCGEDNKREFQITIVRSR